MRALQFRFIPNRQPPARRLSGSLKKILIFLIGTNFLSALAFEQNDKTYDLNQDALVQVGSETIHLKAGQKIKVLQITPPNALVELPLSGGGTGITQIRADYLKVEESSPAVISFSPTHVATPPQPPPPLVSPPPSTSQSAEGYDLGGGVILKKGWQTIHFPNLPTPEVKPAWFPYGFNASEEEFIVYVPASYDPKQPCGIFGWTNPNDNLSIPKEFVSLFEKYRFIAISAKKCGNNQESPRRAGLLTSAALKLQTVFTIDPHRMILSGLSGGGRLSALGCFVHPEVWSGAISWCGGNFYKDYDRLEKPGFTSAGIAFAHHIPNAVTSDNVQKAKSNVRFVLITGDKDFNLQDSRNIERALQSEHFQSLLIEEPGLGHRVGSNESLEKAMQFTLMSTTENPSPF